MKKLLPFVLIFVLGVFLFNLLSNSNETEKQNEIASIKLKHKNYVENNPFKEVLKLSKKDRKAAGLPPNKYLEEQWILTMNPELGRPTPLKVAELQKELLNNNSIYSRTPGDKEDNLWIERGPNNVGGRTRALMFDPNDTTDETVFAGGVSGGLWKNTNISNPNSEWTLLDIPENLAVSSIAFDPNNTQIFYVGTGESYVGHSDGAVNGDGLWKSSDGGNSWTQIFGGSTGESYFVSASTITVNSPSSIAADYQSYPTTAFGSEITTTITAEFILANDTSGGEPTEGCNTFGADATGKIAVIRRGNCNFDDKVRYAEDAGAIGVIMMNNVSGEPVPMGGDDTTITIPSVMISMEDGDLIEAALNSGTVTGSLNPSTGNFTALVVPGIQHINDIKIKNNNGTSEIYVAASDASYGSSNAATTIGGLSYGVYKSVDEGTTWTESSLPLTANGNKYCPNDIEVSADGTIWMSTTNSKLYGDGGGSIFSSNDGDTFNLVYEVGNAARTQIAVSNTNAGVIYVLAETTSGVTILSTTSAFVPSFGVRTKTLPNDDDTDISATDFTRGQAFYDLLLEVSPDNDDVLYTGGIDLFKSTDGADTWSQFSHWYGGWGHQYVHADQHIAAFGNNDSNKVIFGNDGGVYYSADGGTTTEERNNGFNTSQFYTVGVGPTTAYTGDYFAGGLQDNGTQLVENGNPTGTSAATEIYGGDGAYTFFDQDGTDRYLIRNYVYNSGINLYNFDGDNVTINNEDASNGAFINPQDLDSNLDILYSNYTGTEVSIMRYSGIKSSATLTQDILTDDELTASPTAFKVSPYTTTSTTLFVGTFLGDVILVENANTATPTWTNLDGNELVGSVSDIELGQSEDDIFVTMHNYGVNNIWYSNDGGSTWQEKDGNLPDIPVKTILQNPLNLEEVIIGTELGVWYTNNFSSSSPTWETSYNGMSNVKVLDLDLRDDNMVFAATYGRGIFSGQFTGESLSIQETLTQSEFRLYPTVTTGEISIKSASNIGETKLNIYDISGKNVFSTQLNLDNTASKLDLNSLRTGIYLVKATNNNKTITTKIIRK
ncbi:PA domain-containing protein [Neotamlana laminarinivorans]|uniref:T9SS type A sorting domain-containing protein n=1 Tax=Neotamlana laminarinivorans TaxID=2883124 RepID=A0A9X1I1G8_9FLAO|nr:PA domain-containing protein [Tamlana laminarinivorans]MCB4799235.1 T9SS type A sorting domain-containing protein [Tamlana laminarinivorans]